MQFHSLQANIRFTRNGSLLPWIGPALRGLIGHTFKPLVCMRATAATECQEACQQPHECIYGQIFDTVLRRPKESFRGRENTIRPFVVSPYYPVPKNVRAGYEMPVRLVGIGPQVATQLETLVHALDDAGRTRGIKPDNTTFEVIDIGTETAACDELNAADLPPSPDAIPGRLPRVGIGLVTPLCLLEPGFEKGRRAIVVPTFADLFRSALRCIGELFRVYDKPLDANFTALKQAAEQVPLIEHCYTRFSQPKFSSRSNKSYRLHGTTGGGVYANVPTALIPWLVWGGRLHVGQHRIAGAGSWRLVLQ